MALQKDDAGVERRVNIILRLLGELEVAAPLAAKRVAAAMIMPGDLQALAGGDEVGDRDAVAGLRAKIAELIKEVVAPGIGVDERSRAARRSALDIAGFAVVEGARHRVDPA